MSTFELESPTFTLDGRVPHMAAVSEADHSIMVLYVGIRSMQLLLWSNSLFRVGVRRNLGVDEQVPKTRRRLGVDELHERRELVTREA